MPEAILENGRDLVARGWTQGAHARDRHGEPVDPWSSEAVAWSLVGAIVCGDDAQRGHVPISELAETASELANELETSSLNEWNDKPERVQADVIGAFDAALRSSAVRRESMVRRSSA